MADSAAGRWTLRKPVTAVLLLGAATAQAGPVDGQVTSGAASISQSGSATTINQSSQNASLTWKSFNVGAQESVNFVQPSASAIAVNRILDTHGSQILGQLNANGQVFLINPNGILFGAGAQVNVGGLVASTLDVKDADLSNGKRSFSGAGAGSVVNQGRINAATGGYVALVGNTVRNQGTINAPQGSVALAAGSAATLTFQGNQLLKIEVDQSVLNSLAENGGLILADGGQALMSAGAKDSLLASAVNNTGVIQARTVENRSGTIILLGGMAAGTANIAGTLDASAPNGGNGGFVETSGAQVNIADGARITTAAPAGQSGTWLIDPVDFTIAAAGGNITGAALSANLGSGNVVIQSSSGNTGTAGDVNVNDVVSWSINQLTLNAQNNININANLNASGTGKLALEYGQGNTNGITNSYNVNNGAKINLPAGNNFSTKQGSNGTPVAYTVITDLGTATSTSGTDLQGMSGNLNGRYALGADIDASPTSAWNGGSGFEPLGNNLAQFSGILDGLGHTISGLTINRPTATYVGLLGYVGASGRINNLGLAGGSVTGQTKVGALAGWSNGNITNSYASTSVTGSGSEAGGLVGTSQGVIRNSHASGAVIGSFIVGGLVGWNQGLISDSYATGSVGASSSRVGGLVGDMLNGGSVSNSYASGNVTSTGQDVGGLVGYWDSNGTANVVISNSYASGTVSGTTNVGGLVGYKFDAGGTINSSYATGAVSGTSNLGGLVGLWDAGTAINNSFWDTVTTGRATSSGGGMGMTTAQMQQQANFSSATAANGNVNPNWDFTSVWRIYEGNSRPLLKALMKATTVTVANTSKTYDRLSWNGGTSVSCSNVACGSLSGSIGFGGTAQGAVNAGSYTVTASGLYSNQQGYDISYANGTLTVNPASLAVTGVSANNKVYDAGTTATLNGTASVTAIAGDTVSIAGAGSGAFADKNVGNGKAVTVTGYTLGGADAGNYVIVQPTGLTANITPASLAVGGVTIQNKVYNASDAATINGTASVAAFAGDTVNVAGTGIGRFADKNVGNGKVVTVTGYTLGGADAGNYTVVQPTGFTANITPANLAVTGVGANNKVYDTTTTATLNGTAAVTALGGDTVTLGGTGSGNFANKNVGNGKVVTVTGYTLGGADAGNYTVVQPTSVTANITPASLAVTGVGANNKVYDTTTTATLSGTAAVTALGGDTVTVGGTGSGNFNNKNVGNGKVVTVTGYTLGGADASNYTVVQPTAVTANITPASLAVTGVGANNKVYDTTTTATLSGTAAVTALGGDTVTVGGTGNGAFANKNVGNGKAVTVTGYTLGGADAGNYTVVQPTSLTANITPASLTVTGVGANNKVYDTTTTATLSGTAAVTALGGDTVTVGGTGSGTFANKNVGNGKVVTVTGYTLGGADAGNYTVVQPTAVTANITPASLAVTGVSANNKVYDTTTTATLSGTAAITALGGDTVTVGGTGSGNFVNKNVGNGKTVTVTGYTLGGADAGNYTVVQPTGVTANITPASLAVTGVGANNKVYDTTTTATLNGTAAVAALSGDVVTVGGGSGTFANKNVGNGKAVTVAGYTLGGADAGNYTVVQPTGLTANITPAGLAVTGVGANNKVYDTTTTATLNGMAAVTALGGDVVAVAGTGSGSFANKNVGNGKAVTVTGYTLSGADAGNYTVVQPTAVTASITPASLAVTGLGANNKVYDATTTATLNGTAAVTALGGDVVTVGGGSGAFADKNVGNGKAVTVTGYTLGGADAGNYTVVQPTSLTANITPASLTVTGVNANNKVYDTTTAATLSGTAAVTALGGDAVTVGGAGSASFANKNVGNGKAVTVTGYTLGGADAGNYTVVQPTSLTANITPASLTVSGVSANNKVYDTTTTATLSGTAAVTALGGDTVTVGGTGSGNFANKNVGNGKAVTVTGYTLGGADAGNYTVVQPTGVTANITPASLAITGVGANNKVYDTTTTATLNGTANVAALGGDVVTVGGGSGTFADKNVGNGKAVTVSGYTLGGADAGNYTVVQPTGVTANITPANLAVTGVGANNKVYDTTTTATLSGTAAVTALGGDTVTVGGTGNGAFANKNVGNGKAVTVTGYTLGGADAGNYTVVQPTSVTANITPASLAVTGVSANNKVYDTTTTATLSGTAAVTALGGDTVTVGGTGSGTFANKNVGNGKVVTVTGYALGGADAGNYTVVQPTAVTANITPASLAVTGVGANNKVYDTTTTATLNGTAAVTALGGDTVTVGGTGSGNFNNKNVGNGKAVTVTGYTLGGADASNYIVVQPTAVTANITPASVAVTGVGANSKVYDAGTAATLNGTAAVAALGGDVVSVSGGSGTFTDKNVGNSKVVTVTGYTLGGADAGNYTVVQPTGLAANITPASLAVTGVGANNKVYDTTTNVTLNGTAGVTALGGDVVTVGGTGSGAFANKNVGNGKVVTVTGYTLGGADAGNYTVVQPTGVTANITPASLAVTGVNAQNKVFDGTTAATLGGTAAVAALVGDVVSVSGGSGAFANANVGNAKPVTVTGYTLGGVDAANYTVVQPTGLTASITPLPVTAVPARAGTLGRGGADDGADAAMQQAVDGTRSKSGLIEVSPILRVTRSASADASGGDELVVSGGAVEVLQDVVATVRKDPRLHIVDGGVQLQNGVLAAQK
ncbi:beta strand repeat-containing protein [Polaromonas sp. P5_D5]